MNKTIKIGPQTFDIVTERDLHRGSDGLDGWIRFYNSTINLDDRLNEFGSYQVLWHEIVHALFTMAGIEPSKVPEEAVDALAYGIMNVLQNNKWLAIETSDLK